MQIRPFALAVLALCAVSESVSTAHAAQGGTGSAPHNVLMVVMDDVGTDMVGVYESYETALGRPPGSPASTPALDQLVAGQGLTFTAAWAAPMCSPTRAQILTGKFGSHSGIGAIVRVNPFGGSRNPGLYANATLLPEAMHAGPTPYACAAVGKWHLADIHQIESDAGHPLGLPYGRWFDYFAGARFNLEQASSNSGVNVYWNWKKLYASALPGVSTPCAQPCQLATVAPPSRNYATADTTEDALALMATLPEPWFLYVAYNAIHAPVHVPPSDLPSAPCLPSSGPQLACVVDVNGTAASRARCMMSSLDQEIGRLVCASNSSNTTVIVIGDNGTAPANIVSPFDPLHGKGTVYEGGVRVPLIIRSPLIPPSLRGGVESRFVGAVDLFATVAEIGGAPANLAQTADCVSLVPYLTGTASSPLRSTNYTESFFPNFKPEASGAPPANYVCSFQNQTIRNGRFKLIRRTSREHSNLSIVVVEEELYDLERGGPLDTSVTPPAQTPDWFEENDLLASGQPLKGAARHAYGFLSSSLNLRYPTLVR